jgi:hypothetical protein
MNDRNLLWQQLHHFQHRPQLMGLARADKAIPLSLLGEV